VISYWGIDHGETISKDRRDDKYAVAGGVVGGATGRVVGQNLGAGGKKRKLRVKTAAMGRANKYMMDATEPSTIRGLANEIKGTHTAYKTAPGMKKIIRGGYRTGAVGAAGLGAAAYGASRASRKKR